MAYSVGQWQSAIQRQIKRYDDKWYKRAKKVIKRYRDERETNKNSVKQMNMLWSNIETLKPALYSRVPKPDISRRFKDRDPVARHACEVLERALSYSLDSYDFDAEMKSVVEDYLLPGRATVWGKYKPTYGDEVTPKMRVMQREDGYFDENGNGIEIENIQMDEMGGPYTNGEPYRPVVYEEVECEYVYWQDLVLGPTKRWKDTPWIARAAYMTREELVERFGDVGKLINLDCKQADNGMDYHDNYDREKGSMEDTAKIWEVWDKRSHRVYWLSMSYKEGFLDDSDPPLNLRNFFPCPKPLFAVSTNDTMMPIPEYVMYQDQAEEIDTLTQRINKLVKQIKLAGAYPGSSKETLGRLMLETVENKLIPVDDWAMFAERGGIENMISWLPIDQVVNAVIRLYEAREQTKQELYEITGIADLLRGASDPNATATAERIKGQFATLRISDRQDAIAKFIRDAIEIKAEIMCEHFTAQTFQSITGLPVPDEVMQLFQNDAMRGFRIDIETDSTIKADEQMEQQERTGFLEAVTSFLGTLMPMAKEVPQMAPLLSEMILFGVRGFKAGRQLEESIEQFVEQMQQQAQQSLQQPPQPDAKQIEAQAKAQKAQQDMQIDQAKFQNQTRLENARFQHDSKIQDAEFDLKKQEVEQDHELAQLKARLGNL